MYKRQVLKECEEWLEVYHISLVNERGKGYRLKSEENEYRVALKNLIMMKKPGEETVSYTHLDVYKRQITEMRRSIALLKRYQIIAPLDVLEELNEETRIMIYPCVNVVLLGDDIRRLIESFSKEGIDSEFSEDESAVFGTIEDMPE